MHVSLLRVVDGDRQILRQSFVSGSNSQSGLVYDNHLYLARTARVVAQSSLPLIIILFISPDVRGSQPEVASRRHVAIC